MNPENPENPQTRVDNASFLKLARDRPKLLSDVSLAGHSRSPDSGIHVPATTGLEEGHRRIRYCFVGEDKVN
jgi:hypothetical protein